VLAFQPFKPSALRAVQSSKFQVQGVLQIVPAVQTLRSVQGVPADQTFARSRVQMFKVCGVVKLFKRLAGLAFFSDFLRQVDFDQGLIRNIFLAGQH
jgi:hypothetical protein